MIKEKQAHGGSLIRAEKGDVLNPKGKLPGTRSFKTIYKRLLKKEITHEEAGGALKITQKELIALLNVKTATDEHEDPNVRMKAAELITKQIGEVGSKKVDITTNGEKIGGSILDGLSVQDKAEILRILQKADAK